MKKTILSILLLCITLQQSLAQEYGTYFEERTLRLDYIFSGNASSEVVAVDQLVKLPHWYGRRTNLSNLQWKGNGQIRVLDSKTGKCIYTNAFSTLFQEWQTMPEAKQTRQSFENTFLVPFPKEKVTVEILLRTKGGLYKSSIKHTIDPKDILIKEQGFNYINPFSEIHRGGEIEGNINVVFVAEGYTIYDMTKFKMHAKQACNAILKHEAFAKNKDKFNFFAAEIPSKDSGVSIPRSSKWVKTAFSSHFDTFYSDRYLTTSNMKDLHDALAGMPYAHIVVLANTDTYGGGGIFNSYTLTTTQHRDFAPVVAHEFGHSFGGLGDEYYYEKDTFSDFYPFNIEPWEPNITTLVQFSSKWKKLLAAQTPIPTPIKLSEKYPIGVFEGAGYSAKRIYRSAADCRMKTNTCTDFCPACSSALDDLIKFYTE